MPEPQNKRKSLKYGWQLAVLYFTIGFTFFLAELSFYGPTLFIALPMVVGLSAGFLPNKKYGLIGAYVGLIAFFILLIAGRFEGLACLIYTLPFAGLIIFIGWLTADSLRRRTEKKSNTLKFFILPFFFFGSSAIIENIIGNSKAEDIVSTSMYLPYPPEKVWDYIKAVDTLDTEKPFWLKLGLPVPVKCVLESEQPGAKRICYFDEGFIEEEVTELKKPEVLKMKVTNYNLQGMHWLSFKDAIYTFEKKDTGTVITRITTYYSELKPRFYWRLCEHHAIGNEHDYVLSDLKKRLEQDSSK
jgi:hypothetical protein